MACFKKIFIILLIFLSFATSVFATEVLDVNDNINNANYYYSTIQNDFLLRLSNRSSTEEIKDKIKEGKFNYYLYYASNSSQKNGTYMLNSTGLQTSYLFIAFYEKSASLSPSIYETYQGYKIGSIYKITSTYVPFIYAFDKKGDLYTLTADTDLFVPQLFLGRVDSRISDFVNGRDVSGIISAIEKQTEATDKLTNSVTDSTITSTSDDLPNDNTTDITDGGFTTVFNSIRDTFKSKTGKSVELVIPFVNKKFSISKQTVYGNLSTEVMNYLQTFVNSVWYFSISLFILKDISNKIKKIKTGDIENLENDNIKEDIL